MKLPRADGDFRSNVAKIRCPPFEIARVLVGDALAGGDNATSTV
jgi:hypothetical protein